MRSSIARYLSPLASRRDRLLLQQLEAVRQRDGENCRRCRRPLRFDLPGGHDSAPKLERIAPEGGSVTAALDSLCLCHRRCNAESCDHTAEVLERMQRRDGAAARGKGRKRAASRAAA